MCCEHGQVLDLPAPVIEMLARYRELRRRNAWDWGGEDIPPPFRWARFSRLGDVIERGVATGDWPGALREVVGDDVPAGMVVVRGGQWRAGPPRLLIPGGTTPIDVVTGDDLETVDVREAPFHGAVRMCAAATLRLVAPTCARWSVTDETGGAWFPEGVPRKWDVHDRPFFHGQEVTLAVPAAPLTVTCTRGLEFDVVTEHRTPSGDETVTVEADPPRLFDPVAAGWYGGDLHAHLNYSGDLVCTPEDAARMQHGEGLHLLSLVAGNFTSSRVYDRELLAATAGRDLWTAPGGVARMGVEYRNDLLGHVHGLGPSGEPEHYHAGHKGSDAPDDWPPNSVACAELRALGATTGYAHPAWAGFPDDWSTDRFFAEPRSVEARELVADAVLGLVDSLDLLSPADAEGAAFLYHRLLSCGLRPAATAGTDVFLSFAHGPGASSNPPGHARVYAHLGDEPLSVPAFQQAIRECRTVVTNGPWLTMTVDGQGPGAVLDRSAGDTLTIEITCTGDATVTVVSPDGELATGAGRHEIVVDGPLWIAAVARGPGGGRILADNAFAHTSPVFVEVAGRRPVRGRDVRWCLEFLSTFEAFVAEHGRFSHDHQRADLAGVIAQARTRYETLLRRVCDCEIVDVSKTLRRP